MQAPLSGAMRNTLGNTKQPSSDDLQRWRAITVSGALSPANNNGGGDAARRGTLFESDFENPNRVAAEMGAFPVNDDSRARYFVDRGVYDNLDTLKKLSDEYKKQKDYSSGDSIIRKYYDKIENKTPAIHELFNDFAYRTQILRDSQQSGGEVQSPSEWAEMGLDRYLNIAKARYGARKV